MLNADGVTPSVPDGSLSVFNPTTFYGGVHGTHNAASAGLDLPGKIASVGTAFNPGIGTSTAALPESGRLGDLVIYCRSQPGFPRGAVVYDGSTPTPLPVFAWDAGQKLGFFDKGTIAGAVAKPSVQSGTAKEILTALAALGLVSDNSSGHTLPQYAYLDYVTPQTDATTTLTTPTDVTASGLAASWVTAVGVPILATALDVTFIGPTSGFIWAEASAYLKSSATSTDVQFCINDITGTPTAVTNSVENIWAATAFGRARYKRRFAVVAGQVYTWRLQWQLSAAGTATMEFAGRKGSIDFGVTAA